MARDDRVAQLIQLLRDADASGNDDLAQEVRSDLFKEFGLEMNNGGMMNINNMTAPLGYDNGGQVGDKEEMIKSYELAKSLNPDERISDKDFNFAEKMLGGNITEKEKIALAYKLAQAQNPDERFSEKDFQLALEQVNASSADPSSMKSLADILDPSGRITDTDREFARRMSEGTQRSIGPAGASIVSDDGKRILENKKETGIGTLVKDRIKNARENWFAPKQYEGGDDPEYMKLFDFFWKKGYDQQQIDDIIDGKVDPTEIVPSRQNLDEEFKG